MFVYVSGLGPPFWTGGCCGSPLVRELTSSCHLYPGSQESGSPQNSSDAHAGDSGVAAAAVLSSGPGQSPTVCDRERRHAAFGALCPLCMYRAARWPFVGNFWSSLLTGEAGTRESSRPRPRPLPRCSVITLATPPAWPAAQLARHRRLTVQPLPQNLLYRIYRYLPLLSHDQIAHLQASSPLL